MSALMSPATILSH